MKKILRLFSALTLVLISSCSSDDAIPDLPSDLPTDSPSGIVLLKKIITTDPDGVKITTNLTYDGLKLVSMVDDSGEKDLYYYTDDLITKIVFKLSDGTVKQINTYEYDSNKRLVTFVRTTPIDELGIKEVYIYNTDGSVSIKAYFGDDQSQTNFNGDGKIIFADGEVASITTNYSPDLAYKYDNKNSPMKNVLGNDKIPFDDSEASGILHNIVSEEDLEHNDVTSYVYTYNSDNYPIKEVENEAGKLITREYFY